MSVDIAKRFFSKYENEYLSSLPESLKNVEMIKLWTLKESYMKAKGSTFLIPLDKFYFDITDMGKIKFYLETGEDSGKWKFAYYPLENGHHLSVCHDINDCICSMKIHDAGEYINRFIG
jgi:4'-phosphopantetheinyl transferase